MQEISVGRATIISGLLVCLGSIIGVLIANRGGSNQIDSNDNRLKQLEFRIQTLTQELSDRNSELSELRKNLERSQLIIEGLESELRDEKVRGGSPIDRKELNIATAPTEEVPEPRATIPLATGQEQGFKFDIMSCEDEGSTVRCDVIITNTRGSRWIWIDAGFKAATYFVDSEGNTCNASESSFVWGTLPQDVPIRMVLIFGRCPRNISLMSYFELVFKMGSPISTTEYKVPFRDIAVASG